MKIAVLPFVSTIHPETYYMDQIRSILERTRDKGVSVAEPISSEKEVPEADVYIAALLTGGTSGLAYKVLSKVAKPVVIVAKGMHNALASGLSLRSRLQSNEYKTILIPIEDNDSYGSIVRDIVDALIAAEEMRDLRILEINESGFVGVEGKLYTKRFGGTVEVLSVDTLYRLLTEVREEEAKRLLEDRASLIASGESIVESLRVARLVIALKKYIREKGFGAVMIDCFPMIMRFGFTPCYAVSILNSEDAVTICESDYYSLPLMYLSIRLTGFPGLIVNPSGYTRDGVVRFAHCTIPYRVGKDCRLVSHFETGKPYALACRYLFGEALFMRFDRDFNKLKVYSGEVVASGLLSDGYCRTQLYVRFRGVKPEDFYRDACGNHHVVVPLISGVRDKLRVVSWWMGWKLEERS